MLSKICSLSLLVLSPSTGPPRLQPGNAHESAPRATAQDHVEKLEKLGLTLTLPAAFGTLEPIHPGEQIAAGWSCKLGASTVHIVLFVMPSEEYGYEEPEDVADVILADFRARHDASFAYEKSELLTGAFGFAPYVALGYGPIHAKDGNTVEGSYYVLGGLLEKEGYSLEVRASPALDAGGEKTVLEFLRKGVAYKGPARNAQWTDAEVKARWAKDAPPELLKKQEETVRTKHYLFLSNTSAAKQMGEAMEAAYVTIQKTYPFPEVAGRRLMPVFLFRDPDEYYAFYAKAFEATLEEARESKGVAWRDFYATYYDAPQDPVHIHEMTHQIFGLRLRLGGGGSWFQEGVAEYLSTRPGDRVDAANAVKNGRHTPLVDFIRVESLIDSSRENAKGEGGASSNYAQAAMLIEFVREAKWSKDKFLDWVHAIGNCPYNNVVAIERATQATLGVDIKTLDAKWVEYCKKR